jgi:hypothetical protein
MTIATIGCNELLLRFVSLILPETAGCGLDGAKGKSLE